MLMAIDRCWSMSALSNTVATSFMWLLSTCNVAGMTEALIFTFYLFLIGLDLNSQM